MYDLLIDDDLKENNKVTGFLWCMPFRINNGGIALSSPALVFRTVQIYNNKDQATWWENLAAADTSIKFKANDQEIKFNNFRPYIATNWQYISYTERYYSFKYTTANEATNEIAGHFEASGLFNKKVIEDLNSGALQAGENDFSAIHKIETEPEKNKGSIPLFSIMSSTTNQAIQGKGALLWIAPLLEEKGSFSKSALAEYGVPQAANAGALIGEYTGVTYDRIINSNNDGHQNQPAKKKLMEKNKDNVNGISLWANGSFLQTSMSVAKLKSLYNNLQADGLQAQALLDFSTEIHAGQRTVNDLANGIFNPLAGQTGQDQPIEIVYIDNHPVNGQFDTCFFDTPEPG